MSLSKALASVPLFSELAPDQLEAVAACLRRRTFDERDVIVRRGAAGDALFIITSGKVKVSVPAEEGETIIRVFSAGDFFGELAILDGENRSANVIALEPTHALVLSASDMRASLAKYPGIATAFLRELAGRVRRSTEWMQVLMTLPVDGRIAAQLVHLSDTQGVDLPSSSVDGAAAARRGERLIRLRLTQNDIASIVGASRESVNKAMGYLKSKGWISVDNLHYITIHDHEALRKRCQ